MPVTPDPFWDSSGSIRCSSDGIAATQYHDPATHKMECSDRSISACLPARGGLRGLVVPRATAYGGSKGFNAHTPRLINVDPDIKGQSCVVDLGHIDVDKFNAIFEEVKRDPMLGGDRALIAAQTMHRVAVGYEPVGVSSSPAAAEERTPPVGKFLGYVVPEAAPGGGQRRIIKRLPTKAAVPVSPTVDPSQYLAEKSAEAAKESISPNGAPTTNQNEHTHFVTQSIAAPVPMVSNTASTPTVNGFPHPGPTIFSGTEPHPDSYLPAPLPTVPLPLIKVTFGLEGWDHFEAAYHAVIRNGLLLVLAFDSRFTAGMKFFPPAAKGLMSVRVEGGLMYHVHSTGSRFVHGGYEYCVLVIDSEGIVKGEI